jgi:5-methylcytosine-specific restriction endonuclease McrA
VNKHLEYNDPMSATIDHIIPISLGGRHCAENVQLAHRICNNKKGYTGKGDQLLMFG